MALPLTDISVGLGEGWRGGGGSPRGFPGRSPLGGYLICVYDLVGSTGTHVEGKQSDGPTPRLQCV